MIKKLSYFTLLILAILFLKWCSAGFPLQTQLKKHPYIGKKVYFHQPVSYIERVYPSIVPIVAKTKKEIVQLHEKLDSEKINQYIPSSTVFTISDAYEYKDLLNSKTIYFILSAHNEQYILSQNTLINLQKEIYENAQVPLITLDQLYKDRQLTATIRFYLKKLDGRYYDLFNKETFKKCGISKTISHNNEIITTVDFNQLACLYSHLWNNLHSAKYPINYEIIN